MLYIFQIRIETPINIRYVHLTSPQLCCIGVDVIGWLLSFLFLSLSLFLSRSLNAICYRFFSYFIYKQARQKRWLL